MSPGGRRGIFHAVLHDDRLAFGQSSVEEQLAHHDCGVGQDVARSVRAVHERHEGGQRSVVVLVVVEQQHPVGAVGGRPHDMADPTGVLGAVRTDRDRVVLAHGLELAADAGIELGDQTGQGDTQPHDLAERRHRVHAAAVGGTAWNQAGQLARAQPEDVLEVREGRERRTTPGHASTGLPVRQRRDGEICPALAEVVLDALEAETARVDRGAQRTGELVAALARTSRAGHDPGGQVGDAGPPRHAVVRESHPTFADVAAAGQSLRVSAVPPALQPGLSG